MCASTRASASTDGACEKPMNELAPLPHDLTPAPTAPGRSDRPAGRGRLAAFLDSDLLHSFLRSKLVVLAALLPGTMVRAAFLAPPLAPPAPYGSKSRSRPAP